MTKFTMIILVGGLASAGTMVSAGELSLDLGVAKADVSIGGGSVADASVDVGGGDVADVDASVGGGSVADVDASVGRGSVADANVSVGGGSVADADVSVGRRDSESSLASVRARVGGQNGLADVGVGIGNGTAGVNATVGGSGGGGTSVVGMPLIGSNGTRLGTVVSASDGMVCSSPSIAGARDVCVSLRSTPVVTRSGLRVRVDAATYRAALR